MATLTLQGLSKRFGDTMAVEAFDLEVGEGELVCLLGPSGSGKSTVLRMIGGFELPSTGSVLIGGEDVTRMRPERRPTSTVFQSHALWSHMNVAGNIGFGLKLRKLSRAEVAQKVEDVLDLVGLRGLAERRPDQLSGGQQQRVALARALVLEPKILLMDEPFASLDQHLRERLREEVRDLQRRLGITMLFVTHGQDEALSLADRIVVMQAGRIEQVDKPDLLYRAPRTPFVAGFIGAMNMLEAPVQNGRLEHPQLSCAAPVPDGAAFLAVRPESLGLAKPQSQTAQSQMVQSLQRPAKVHRVTDFGNHAVVEVTLDNGQRVRAMLMEPPAFEQGDEVMLTPRAYTLYRDDRVIWRTQSPKLAAATALDARPVNQGMSI
ncbi:ABC transporter ATP-binding protein [Roseinatronobacter sp. S2]|uniref:ABC transporter ATP-binding protein n=1 Tax=Roseinatronobacter sp. S2 TaxID=3035471 RepID=UPI002410A033|nr:ABC transporter ATP-binding protein [Roseinatronobacter sp. S2]WFE77077.1 ABC transporter ATP-binding protein [Roseinatronobacter sp. S2]